jgi:serine/threonine protein phosphatase 1
VTTIAIPLGRFAYARGGQRHAALTNGFMSHTRTIAIGDIHGCRVALDTLLTALALGSDDTLVVLGDAIDRGPDSRGVLERLLALREECRLVPILGNHEQMLLEAIDGRIPLQDWLMHGGAETLDSYGKDAALSEVSEEHIRFLRTWGDYHETASHFFVHGNYQPQGILSQQPWRWLRWESLRTTLPAVHSSGKTAVMGHTSDKRGEILNLGHLTCIDTYCCGGHWLTALEPDTRQVWQANEHGEQRESSLPPPR